MYVRVRNERNLESNADMDNSLLSRHRAVGEVAAAVGGGCADRDEVFRLEPEPRLEPRARARSSVKEQD